MGNWAAGLAGGLQGLNYALQNGIAYNREQARQQHDDDLKLFSYFAEHGDDQVQQLALEGLTDLHSKSGGWKTAFKGAQPHPNITKIRNILAAQAGPPGPPGGLSMPPAGSAVPPPGAAMAAPISSMGGPPSPDFAGGAPAPTMATTDYSGTPSPSSAPPGPPPSAALPSTSPTAATGSSAGQGDELSQSVSRIPSLLQAAGVGKPGAAPTRAGVREEVAREFGLPAAQLEDPNFAITNHMQDPQKLKLQNEYRTRLQQALQTATVTHKGEESEFAAGVRNMVTQLMATSRTETTQQGAETRYTQRQKDTEARDEARYQRHVGEADARQNATIKKQALFTWEREVAAIEKVSHPTTLEGQILLKQNPNVAQERLDAADERYRNLTGEDPPVPKASERLARARTQGTAAATAGAVARGNAGVPPGAPPAAASARPPGAPPPSASSGGPPLAPVTAMDEQRAAGILATLKRRGEGSLDSLSPEDQNFIRDYMKRKKAALAGG